MKISISKPALQWYKNEMDLHNGDFVRLFARYGGHSTIQQGFSLGISNEQPKDMGVHYTTDGITFFVEKDDEWYFDDYDLNIKYDNFIDGVEFEYKRPAH
ncbi:HesB/YadR/YfhF family protein [Bacillus marinisedimentorum]|uniref:HesB/YadR/YfhF family protein n=1 Tax=Bacillus marinisedimentorum TaxID=1821260 RepID=UPI0007DFD180|nr:HesB/YadR/YfhF family protein [Bacillus marinisedimentorum]